MLKKTLITLCALLLAALGLSLQPGATLQFTAERKVPLDPAQSWAVMSDLSVAHHYVPGVLSTELIGSDTRGTGAVRRVHRADDYLDETVIHWREGSGFTLRLQQHDGVAPPPFHDALFHYRLIDTGVSGSSRIRLQLEVIMAGGKLGQYIGQTLLSNRLEKSVQAVADGLVQYYGELR